MHGARYLHVHVTCPLGWGSARRRHAPRGAPGRESGLFPVFEAEHGEVTAGTADPRGAPGRGVPALQRRFAHLFGPARRRGRDRPHPGDRRPQHRALRACSAGLRGSLMDKPFAITLDVGSSLANHTGRVADRAPGLRRAPAAVQRRLPGRRGRPGVALPRRGGRLPGAPGGARSRQPASRGDGPGLLPPVRERLQPRAARRGRRRSTRSSASWATSRSGRVAAAGAGRRRRASGSSSSAPGRGGSSAAYHLARSVTRS